MQLSSLLWNLKIYCIAISGYPGTPEVESSHFIEQSPGYGHPYLPSISIM